MTTDFKENTKYYFFTRNLGMMVFKIKFKDGIPYKYRIKNPGVPGKPEGLSKVDFPLAESEAEAKAEFYKTATRSIFENIQKAKTQIQLLEIDIKNVKHLINYEELIKEFPEYLIS